MSTNNKLFVGNLSWTTTDEDLNKHFSKCGTVLNAKIITDRSTQKSRGFGFVEMETNEEAKRAIEELDNVLLNERNLRISLAEERGDGEGKGMGGGRPRERKEYSGGNDFRGGGGGRSSYSNRGDRGGRQ